MKVSRNTLEVLIVLGVIALLIAIPYALASAGVIEWGGDPMGRGDGGGFGD